MWAKSDIVFGKWNIKKQNSYSLKILHKVAFCWLYFLTCGEFIFLHFENESQEFLERGEDFLKF